MPIPGHISRDLFNKLVNDIAEKSKDVITTLYMMGDNNDYTKAEIIILLMDALGAVAAKIILETTNKSSHDMSLTDEALQTVLKNRLQQSVETYIKKLSETG